MSTGCCPRSGSYTHPEDRVIKYIKSDMSPNNVPKMRAHKERYSFVCSAFSIPQHARKNAAFNFREKQSRGSESEDPDLPLAVPHCAVHCYCDPHGLPRHILGQTIEHHKPIIAPLNRSIESYVIHLVFKRACPWVHLLISSRSRNRWRHCKCFLPPFLPSLLSPSLRHSTPRLMHRQYFQDGIAAARSLCRPSQHS